MIVQVTLNLNAKEREIIEQQLKDGNTLTFSVNFIDDLALVLKNNAIKIYDYLIHKSDLVVYNIVWDDNGLVFQIYNNVDLLHGVINTTSSMLLYTFRFRLNTNGKTTLHFSHDKANVDFGWNAMDADGVISILKQLNK